jgi:hypothetical protein
MDGFVFIIIDVEGRDVSMPGTQLWIHLEPA